MDTRFWGPSGWRLLHLTVEAPLGSRSEEAVHELFTLLPFVLPCKFCRYSLSEYYKDRPIPIQFEKKRHWLYKIHNNVNAKLRSQNLSVVADPTYKEVHELYSKWALQPCASTQILGWDFLFSIANTTPSKSSKSSPLENAPIDLDTPTQRNTWNTMNYKERIPYIQKWWDLIHTILPFEPWRDAWTAAELKLGKAPVKKGRKAVLAWLYTMEKTICRHMAEEAPHDSFNGLCKEVSTFSSGCGTKTSSRIKTCRAKKNSARETLRKARNLRFADHGGIL